MALLSLLSFFTTSLLNKFCRAHLPLELSTTSSGSTSPGLHTSLAFKNSHHVLFWYNFYNINSSYFNTDLRLVGRIVIPSFLKRGEELAQWYSFCLLYETSWFYITGGGLAFDLLHLRKMNASYV